VPSSGPGHSRHFAYGYPVDFAAALQAATGMSDKELPWLTVWHYLNQTIKDDEGTTPRGRPTNRSNRFEIANQINALPVDVEKPSSSLTQIGPD
jgi:hypothetical protein